MKNIKKIFFSFLFILFVNKVFSQDNLHNFLEKLHSGNYVIDFYCDVLKSENRDTIHEYSDIYVDREFPDPDYGVVKYKWYDLEMFSMDSIDIRIDDSTNEIDEEFFSISFHGLYIENFAINKNIEIQFKESVNNDEFNDSFSSLKWELVRKNKVNTFYFRFDGDYLYIYLNGETDKDLFATFVNMNDKTFSEFKNLIANNKCDLSNITWPRHADGTCDYEDTSSVKINTTQTTNVTPNKTMTVSENLKLRSAEATTSEVITVMSAGTTVAPDTRAYNPKQGPYIANVGNTCQFCNLTDAFHYNDIDIKFFYDENQDFIKDLNIGDKTNPSIQDMIKDYDLWSATNDKWTQTL